MDLRQGDNRVQLRRMIGAGEFVHSVVTDPPYGLVSVNKRFSGKNAAPAKFGSDGAFQRQSRGFMGKLWDGSGIERDPEFWRLVHDVMLPGAYIVAFSSSRTYGYMQIAMEAAGFITHPMLGWTFASGFPKAHNPRLPEWDGWAYGGQALKPALEPIYVGQKPFSEKNGALNILKHGVGAMNIDGCRVYRSPDDPQSGWASTGSKASENRAMSGANYDRDAKPDNEHGRHPANLLHDGSDEVIALFPNTTSVGHHPASRGKGGIGNDGHRGQEDLVERTAQETDKSAARFFNSFPHEGPLLHYPKAGKKDRAGSKHATVKPIALMRHLVRLVTPPGGVVLDPFAGTGTTGQAALDEGVRCVLMEAELEYARDIRRRFDLPETVSDKLVRLVEAMS